MATPVPPAAARILNIAGESAFVVAFFLFALSPALPLPDRLRLPPARWRWPTGAGIVGCGLAVISVLLAPGPVDEDVPAWGDNPIGLDAAPRFIDALELIGVVLLAVGIVFGLAAFVIRWVRYRGARRQQMAWFTIGVVVHTAGLSTDTRGDSVTVEVLMALAIFGTMLFGIGWPLLGPLGARAEAADHDTSAKPDAEPDPHSPSSIDGPALAT